MNTLIWILIATFIDGLLALVGVFSLWIADKTLRKILLVLVAFSAGALLSGGFFHLLAESLEKLASTTAFIFLFGGFIIFFIVEKFFHWRHCHEGVCDVHPYTYLVLFGDGIHNFIDGLVVAASFMVNINFGLITTLLILTHELPQELGNFGVLVYGGFPKTKALVYNFISQLTCVVGGVLGYLLGALQGFAVFMLPFAAGGFIYIAASDLIPELHREANPNRSLLSFLFFVIGIFFMLSAKLIGQRI